MMRAAGHTHAIMGFVRRLLLLREYELTLITSGQLPESQRDEVYTKYEQMVAAAGGSVLTKDEWGVMKLAHPIQKQFRGHYMCYRLAAPPDVFAGIEPKLRIDPAVLRYLKVKVSDAHDAEHWAAELARAAAAPVDQVSAVGEVTEVGEVVEVGKVDKMDKVDEVSKVAADGISPEFAPAASPTEEDTAPVQAEGSVESASES